MSSVKLRFLTITLVVFCSLQAARITDAAEIHITPTTGDILNNYTLYVDHVDKLAGVKITLNYPPDYLHFESASKGTPFHSFIHVINDKTPGKLIFVMASAKGIPGSNLLLFTLHFKKLSPVSTSHKKQIQFSQCQLMDEGLQEISCTPVDFP